MNNHVKSGMTNVPRWAKALISALVVFHLWAVVSEPIRFATRGPGGPSPAASAFRTPVGMYSDIAYLNHGYAFFAPDPGPSHLVEARWTRAGQEQRLRFPDRDKQWPRLLYHRHFMLSEFLHNLHEPRGLPPDVPRDSPMFNDWRAARDRYELIANSFTRHLEHVHNVENVEIDRIEHRMPGIPEFVDEGIELQHERLYRTLSDGLPELEMLQP